jgi:hypothetical protein
VRLLGEIGGLLDSGFLGRVKIYGSLFVAIHFASCLFVGLLVVWLVISITVIN